MIEESFDFDAYYRDTRRLSIDARGAWMDCLCLMRLDPPRGRMSEPLDVYAVMWGCSEDQAQRVIAQIIDRKVADGIVESDGNITLINRRMFRKWQQEDAEKLATYERQRRHRGDQPQIPVTENGSSKNGDEDTVSRFCHGSVTESDKNASSSVEEINTKSSSPQKKKRLVESSRLPDPFPITSQMTEWATVNVPLLRLAGAHDRFVEYWTNLTTAKAWKVNWLLAWQKGMKLAMGWQEQADARLTAGRYIEPDSPSCGCSKCKDIRKIVKVGTDNLSYQTVPCPDCTEVANAA